jgi:signal transduction histidine kinase/uncharacterized protein YdcH (DUF465 family)
MMVVLADYQKIIDYHKLSMEILSLSNSAVPRIDYFYSILKTIKEYTNCDCLELLLNEKNGYFTYIINESNKFNKKIINFAQNQSLTKLKNNSFLNLTRQKLLRNHIEINMPFISPNGSFWYSGKFNAEQEIKKYNDKTEKHFQIDLEFEALAILPIIIQKNVVGLLQIMSNNNQYLDALKIKLFEGIVHSLSLAIINKRTQGALRERVKELSCLYEISKVAENENLSLEEMLKQIVNLIPPAWQFPEITIGQISLDGRKYFSNENVEKKNSQSCDIIIKGEMRGSVESIYTKNKPDLDEGPFLKEERNLINAIAKQIGLIVERREAEEDKSSLQEQIRHADRLATIGQLAAGVAHELNEPLGNILGFAQLTKKHPELPPRTVNDIDKIIKASLQGREIIKKLMLFSRQMPPKSGKVNINELVKEGLYFFDARCAKAGIKLIRNLEPQIPEIEGDSGQLNQVLVNLVVNSIQAMPQGGDLFINTTYDKNFVYLVIKDTGLGISKELKSKIFIPFFTTKDINEGTGLGLAVVHGIVLSHKGIIEFESEPKKGTRFEIKFPVY